MIACDQPRDGCPRPLPDRLDAERIEAAARATLPAARHAAERARGGTLTKAGTAALLRSASAVTGT